MLLNKHPGIFVAIEGLDGSGLSTQAKLVVDLLRLQSVTAFATKEPTNNVVGGLIRGILSGVTTFPSDGFQLLFAADRSHHIVREIVPSIKDASVVVSDRYFWTSVAYGGINLDRQWLLDINRDFMLPDLTIFLNLKPEVAISRIKKDRFELELFEKKKELTKVRENYMWLLKKFPKNIHMIDAGRDRQEVSREIFSLIQRLPKFSKLKKLK